jgi:hypothetical protein
MKKLITIIVFGVFLPLIMAFTMYQRPEQVKALEITPQPLVKVEVKPKVKVEEIKFNGHKAFLDAIGHFESGNRYHITNRYGYMGKYQFGKSTLKSIGIDVSRKTFLNSPHLQEEAMDRLLTENYKSLRRFINKYEGKYVHGVLITKSGVLAAAHLAGAGNVKRFFRKGYEFKDGNGTKMTTYIKLFNGYELNI